MLMNVDFLEVDRVEEAQLSLNISCGPLFSATGHNPKDNQHITTICTSLSITGYRIFYSNYQSDVRHYQETLRALSISGVKFAIESLNMVCEPCRQKDYDGKLCSLGKRYHWEKDALGNAFDWEISHWEFDYAPVLGSLIKWYKINLFNSLAYETFLQSILWRRSK